MSQAPNLSNDMKAALEAALGGNLPNNLGPIKGRRHVFYHRQAVGAAVLASYAFFNAARARGVSNLPIPQQLPANQAFLITGISVFVTAGVDSAYAAQTPGKTIATAATPTAAVDAAEWLREIHDCGVVSVLVGDFKLVDDIAGLRNFPQGGGVTGGGGAATTVAATNILCNAMTNGAPFNGNRYNLPNPYPWWAGNNLQFEVGFTAAPTPPTGIAAVVTAELDGLWLSRTT